MGCAPTSCCFHNFAKVIFRLQQALAIAVNIYQPEAFCSNEIDVGRDAIRPLSDLRFLTSFKIHRLLLSLAALFYLWYIEVKLFHIPAVYLAHTPSTNVIPAVYPTNCNFYTKLYRLLTLYFKGTHILVASHVIGTSNHFSSYLDRQPQGLRRHQFPERCGR